MEKNYNEKCIRLHKPYLTWNEDGSLCRYNIEITENGRFLKYFAEVEKEYAQYFCTEVLDAVVLMSLTRAFRLGYDIYCDIPVTEQLLHNINEILIPHLALGDPRINPTIRVYAPTTTKEFSGTGVGTAISCGVDSLYSIMEGTNGKYPDLQLTHLFVASVSLELRGKNPHDLVEWENLHKTTFDRINKVSKMTNLPVIKMLTNISMYTLFNGAYRLLHSLSYVSLGPALLLKKLWKSYFYPSAFDFTRFSLDENLSEDTSFYDLLMCHVLTIPGFSLFSGGASTDRINKTLALTEFEPAKRTLHPCHSAGAKNCSNPGCDKCLRGLLTLDYYDKLDELKEVFDIDKYRGNHQHYLYQLVKKIYSDHEEIKAQFFKRLYLMMREKYPKEMEAAEIQYKKDTEPVSRTTYNQVNYAYSSVLKILSHSNSWDLVKNFFYEKDVKSIYISGKSRIGNVIKDILSTSFELKSVNDTNPASCDVSLILCVDSAEISRITKILKNKSAKSIYSINDIIRTIE